jgi:N-methylhydantoinase B
MAKVDPFTSEIVAQSLISASEEMFVAWGRTSQSTIIYEVMDCACGLTDAKGQLIGQASGVTGFLATLTYSVISALAKFGVEGLKPGDIILTNDPYTGSGTHLCDVSAVMPIFAGGELVAFAANKGHWNEIGGMALGSWTTDSTEIYQEGLQFPIIKAYEEGRLNEAVRDMIAANCRTPSMTVGDLYAQCASLRTGERRVVELCKKYGKDTVLASVNLILDQGEQLARQELARLPKGTFVVEDFFDTMARGIDHIPARCEVTITDEDFTIDLTGSGGQVAAPVNCARVGALAAARVAYHAIMNPKAHPNEGFYRPLKFVAPEGTVFTATRPAPVSCHWEPIGFVSDLVFKALAPVLPERITAGHFLSILGTILGGTGDSTGEPFVLCEPQAGGWGAGIDRDGQNGLVSIVDGETFVIPVEVAETKYPIMVEQYALLPKSGAGKFRGGYGLVRDYRLLNSRGELTTIVSRVDFPPWGVDGGGAGTGNGVEIYRHGEEEPYTGSTFARYPINKGDLVRLITGGGGGYGNPLERDQEMVKADVEDGYISVEEARDVYGVVLGADGSVDRAATQDARQKAAMTSKA